MKVSTRVTNVGDLAGVRDTERRRLAVANYRINELESEVMSLKQQLAQLALYVREENRRDDQLCQDEYRLSRPAAS